MIQHPAPVFTRDDLLLLGDLKDVTTLARRVGVHVPVAMSRPLLSACSRVALRRRACDPLAATLMSLRIELERHRDLVEGQVLAMRAPGVEPDLIAHLGLDAHTWVVTMYIAGEVPVLVG